MYWEAKFTPKIYGGCLRETTMFESADARDKIFALAGIAQDGGRVEIIYIKLPMEVFERFARHTINEEESLIILSDAQQADTEDRGTPSWIPRWNKEPLLPSLLDRGFDAALVTKL